jgi:hypothetical protein
LRGRRSIAFLWPLPAFARCLPRLARIAGLLAARLFIAARLFAGGFALLLVAWLLLTTLSITALLTVAWLLASRLLIAFLLAAPALTASLRAAFLASLLLALAAALLILALRTIAIFLIGGLLLASSLLV